MKHQKDLWIYEDVAEDFRTFYAGNSGSYCQRKRAGRDVAGLMKRRVMMMKNVSR